MGTFKVAFKRKGHPDVIVGDAYVVEAKNEAAAKKEVRAILKRRFHESEGVRIAYVVET